VASNETKSSVAIVLAMIYNGLKLGKKKMARVFFPKRAFSADREQDTRPDPKDKDSGADRGWEVSRNRALVGYVLIRRLGYKLKDVAKYLGRDLATVSSLVSRYSERMAQDEDLNKQAARITKYCLE